MAKIVPSVAWTFTLDARETALVLAALGGRLRPEHYDRAKALGDKLTLERARLADEWADQLAAHAEKVDG